MGTITISLADKLEKVTKELNSYKGLAEEQCDCLIREYENFLQRFKMLKDLMVPTVWVDHIINDLEHKLDNQYQCKKILLGRNK